MYVTAQSGRIAVLGSGRRAVRVLRGLGVANPAPPPPQPPIPCPLNDVAAPPFGYHYVWAKDARGCDVPRLVSDPPPVKCGAGTTLYQGQCVPDPNAVTCTIPGMTPQNGACVCPTGQQVVNGACAAPAADITAAGSTLLADVSSFASLVPWWGWLLGLGAAYYVFEH